MTRRRLYSWVLTLAFLIALAGCGAERSVPAVTAPPAPSPSPTPTPAPVEPLKFTLPCYPEAGFHPITGANRTNLVLNGLLYEGLYELDASFMPQNVLAASHTVSEDALTWTFTIQPDITFSDGSPMTASDVAASLNQARQSPLYSARLSNVADITAGQGTVTVTLSAPNGNLPALLDIPVIRGEGTVPLGTGPYVLSADGDSEVLTARAGWWRGLELPQQSISLWAIQEPDDLIYAFDTKEISLVSTDLTGSNTLGYSGSYETLDYPTSVLLYVGFNTRSGPCQDAAVRRALARGFDRATISTALLARHAEVTTLPFPPASTLYDADLADTLAYSPQEMRTQLESAGWSFSGDVPVKGAQTMRLTLLVNQDNTYRVGVAEHLVDSFAQSGIPVTLKKLPWEAYLDALERQQFDLYLGETRLTADFDLSVLLAPDGALNYGGFSDGGISDLLRTFCASSGSERTAAAKKLSSALAGQAPFVPLCFKNWSVLSQRGQISSLVPTQQNVFYHFWTWKFQR